MILNFRILARNSVRSGRWSRTVSPSLRPSQSCPQDVCNILNDQQQQQHKNNNKEPKIYVNDVTAMMSPIDLEAQEKDDEVKEISRPSMGTIYCCRSF